MHRPTVVETLPLTPDVLIAWAARDNRGALDLYMRRAAAAKEAYDAAMAHALTDLVSAHRFFASR